MNNILIRKKHPSLDQKLSWQHLNVSNDTMSRFPLDGPDHSKEDLTKEKQSEGIRKSTQLATNTDSAIIDCDFLP